MSSLVALSSILSEEESTEFIQYLRSKNRRSDTKNVALYKLVRKGSTQNLDITLYGKASRNAFHALSKRLQDSLIDFVASRSFSGETSEEHQILKLLLAARIYFEHKKNKIAFRILQKAEKLALSFDIYAILNEIYHTKIQYAHLNTNIELNDVITQSRTNLVYFTQEQQLNMAYATIKEQLKESPQRDISTIISEAFSNFDIEVSKALTYKSLFQLMHLATAAATIQRNYHTISPFMNNLYEVISEKNKLAEKHLFYHIASLHLMAVTYFRNKDFENSMQFAAKMETEMRKHNQKYYARFEEKLVLIKALNLNYTGSPQKANQVLQELKTPSLDSELTFIMCLFQQEQWSEANQRLQQLNHSDHWYEKKAGLVWVIKKNIIEVLLWIEMDQLDLVLSRLDSFKKRFTQPLEAMGETRVLTFMKLISYYYEYPTEVTNQHFKDQVEASFNWIGNEREDIFVMSFYAWLKAKMEQTSLYETTLALVNH